MKDIRFYLLAGLLVLLPGMLRSQTAVKIKKAEFKTEQETGFEEAWKSIKEGNKLYKKGCNTGILNFFH